MGKKIDWFNGKNALNDYDMQEICDQIANADTPQNLAEVIKGSEQIVVDVAEDNKSLEIHLDAETTADISRSLKTPVSAPTTTKLVAVDTTNSQEMLTLGTGLTIENGTLNASGKQLYQHNFVITEDTSLSSSYDVLITGRILTESSEPLTTESFHTYLIDNGFINTYILPLTGTIISKSTNAINNVCGVHTINLPGATILMFDGFQEVIDFTNQTITYNQVSSSLNTLSILDKVIVL